jgi:hypothetical protein
MRLDARIPVLLVSPSALPPASASSLLLRVLDPQDPPVDHDPDGAWASRQTLDAAPFEAEHRPGCACCAGRSTLAVALAGLFVQRAKARSLQFDQVVLSVPEPLHVVVRRIFRDDPLVAVRFRLIEKSNLALAITC